MWSVSTSANNDDARRRMAVLRRRHRPDNEVPVSVALDAVLGETDDLVVFLSGIRAFRGVLEFQVTALTRHRGTGPGLHGGLFGHRQPEDRFLLGIEYADGRTGSNLGAPPALDLGLDLTSPVLLPGGGGGGDRRADMSYCLSPLPPAGPLRIVAAWPSRGLAETVTEIPADPLIEAAGAARVLWDIEVDEPPARPPLPPMPPGGWFARAVRQDRGVP